jgi:hypothetical protein
MTDFVPNLCISARTCAGCKKYVLKKYATNSVKLFLIYIEIFNSY